MNYIGSKRRLLKHIKTSIKNHHIPIEGIALDLFSGTGVVSELLKSLGFSTYANDWQSYAYMTVKALLTYDQNPSFERLKQAPYWKQQITPLSQKNFAHATLEYLNQLPGKQGLFYNEYCEKGTKNRCYFSEQNGLRIQAIRDTIAQWLQNNLITTTDAYWLTSCLIEAADSIANTASVYGAYLKQVKPSATKKLTLVMPHQVTTPTPTAIHKAFQKEGAQLLTDLQDTPIQLTYIDPPYNERQYAANYHVLETLAKWDLNTFEPRGKTGLRPANQQISDYCLKRQYRQSFQSLFDQCHSEYLLFSYNNEGLLSEAEIKSLFEKNYCILEFKKINYQRFKADKSHHKRQYKTTKTTEFLVMGQKIKSRRPL